MNGGIPFFFDAASSCDAAFALGLSAPRSCRDNVKVGANLLFVETVQAPWVSSGFSGVPPGEVGGICSTASASTFKFCVSVVTSSGELIWKDASPWAIIIDWYYFGMKNKSCNVSKIIFAEQSLFC